MKKLTGYWKAFIAFFIIIVGLSAAVRYASAGSLSVVISGDMLTDGTWEVGSEPVRWSASAYNSDNEDGLPEELTSDSVITWQSSDPSVVRVTPQGAGGDGISQVLLEPVSAGTVTITATYTKNIDNGDGTYSQLVAKAERKAVVKFSITNKPDAPYEDSSIISNIYTTSSSDVVFTSSNENVAQVEYDGTGSGKVILKGAGSTTITAQLSDGQKDSCRIVVNARITETDIPLTVNYKEKHKLLTNAINNEDIYFESANSNIAEIDRSGIITGDSAGKTNVYVRSLAEDDPWYSLLPNPARSITIEVPYVITTIPVLNVGDTATLKTNVADEYSSQVSWNCSDTSVVEITQDGTIRAKRSGTAKIYATIANKELFGTNTAQYAEVTVTVIDAFAISKSEVSVQAGSSVDLSALVTDTDASVKWETSDANIAAIAVSQSDPFKAVVSGIKKGTAVITATQTVDGINKKAQCIVTVTEPVQNITVYPTSINVDKGASYPLTVRFTPELPDNRTIKWESSDTTVATVDQDGIVKGVGGGSAVIWVITEDGIKVASCDVYVRVPVTGVTLSETKIEESLNAGTHQLTAAVTPGGPGVNTNVEWAVSPSDGSIITIDKTGLIKYVAPGNATVIAKTEDGGYMATCQVEVLKPVSSVSLDYKDIRLKVDDTFRLSAEVLPVTASDRTVKWESSDNSIITVDNNGLVSARKPGSAAILVRTNDGGLTAMCNVKVYQPVTIVTISNTELSIRKGTTAWLNATALPSNADDRTIKWSSSDTEIATVNAATGMITAVEAGTCTIIATNEASGVTAKCILTVTQPITDITLNVSRKTIMKDDQFALTPTIKPEDAENKNVTYTSSNTNVATVDGNGVVTGKQGGQSVIVATTQERGLTASCLVTVQEFVTSIKLSGAQEYLQKGDNISLTAEVLPETATNPRITWKSSNPNVISVNSKGVAKAKSYGRATIFAYASDGSGIYDKCTMTVERPLKSISFKTKHLHLIKGESKRIKPIFNPSNATFKDVEWSSADSSIATVDENGVVTAVASGSTAITCKAVKSGIVGTYTVSVKEYVESIRITGQGKRGEISYGYTKQLKAIVKPSTATNKRVKWSSSNTSVLMVDQNGNVVAVGYGTAIITARAVDNSKVKASVGLTVIKPVGNISVNPTSMTLVEGRSATITATITPPDATYTGIRWKTSNPSVATVDYNGGVTAISAGNCKVYAVSTDGNDIKGTTNVIVKPAVPANAVSINSSNITMLPGQARRLSVRIKPSNTTESISWSSSDTSVATVDENGYVVARGQGRATIYVTSSDSGLESTCEIVVLALNATYITLEQYDSYDLDVFGATEKISWYSNNKRVATVSADGKVIARMAGKTTITAKVNGKVLYCTVVVKSM
ncbi:MAG: Ig-like domain-containing protein [Lachnospiraceae bacterium]|nr:Ig-like domain-containing protein [Lachnospiraceae bacterium]